CEAEAVSTWCAERPPFRRGWSTGWPKSHAQSSLTIRNLRISAPARCAEDVPRGAVGHGLLDSAAARPPGAGRDTGRITAAPGRNPGEIRGDFWGSCPSCTGPRARKISAAIARLRPGDTGAVSF